LEQGPWAVVTVQDQGVGIPADELPHVFTPFFRAATARGIAGTGIGLWGAKAIVAQHGGTIDLASTVGVGTTVALRFPCASA
jgi:signal transduction histidine kinase